MNTTPEMLLESLDRDITLSSFAKAQENSVAYAAIKYNPKNKIYSFVVGEEIIVKAIDPQTICDCYNEHYAYIMKVSK